MPHLSATEPKTWATTVMADDQYADRFFVYEAKQNRVWKAVHETPANTMLNNDILGGICTNVRDGRIHLGSKLLTETTPLLVVVRDGIIEIGYGERVILNLHSESPPVRRKNSA